MENSVLKQNDKKDIVAERLQNILTSLSKCKIDFINEKEESKKVREINVKLEVELKEARELEKSHRYHLLSSREMIGNLQETVSQLVHLKHDVKKLKDEMTSKNKTITAMEKDKENLTQKHEDAIEELRKANERHIEEVQREAETQVAQFTCVIEELRSKVKDVEAESREKMNVVVLEYEEKIQRGAAQVVQLQEQLARQTARTDTNIDAYRRRLEELEEKLKQSQFKQYLAQSYPSQFESQVERPYFATRDYETCSVNSDPVLEGPSSRLAMPSQNKAPKQNTLQVMYYGNKTPARTEKKGQFNITKKRKLYNDKDFQDF